MLEHMKSDGGGEVWMGRALNLTKLFYEMCRSSIKIYKEANDNKHLIFLLLFLLAFLRQEFTVNIRLASISQIYFFNFNLFLM